jgi:hypothetical protein
MTTWRRRVLVIGVLATVHFLASAGMVLGSLHLAGPDPLNSNAHPVLDTLFEIGLTLGWPGIWFVAGQRPNVTTSTTVIATALNAVAWWVLVGCTYYLVQQPERLRETKPVRHAASVAVLAVEYFVITTLLMGYWSGERAAPRPLLSLRNQVLHIADGSVLPLSDRFPVLRFAAQVGLVGLAAAGATYTLWVLASAGWRRRRAQ